jgi:shikimate kinase
MGAGKTTVGRVLAEELGWSFDDVDDRIERREHRTVPEIFRDSGEAAFRRAEHAALQELLEEVTDQNGKIIALGGGAFVQNDNCRLIESAGLSTIFLDAAVDELWRRCSAQAEQEAMNRPLRGTLESFRKLYHARRPHYLKAAVRQQTDGKTIGQIAHEIIQTLGLEHKSRKQGVKN